ncbi:hypothetical protein ACIA8C_25160 [Nocardia sp. NPDC051321]
MRRVIGGRLHTDEGGERFLAGCAEVMHAMDIWWTGLLAVA